MSLINKDQIRRQRMLDLKEEAEEIFIRLLTGFAIFTIMALIFTVISISDAEAISCNDYLVSPDMVDYMHNHGRGQQFEEVDMQ